MLQRAKKSKINQSKKSKAARRALALSGPATVAALPKSRVSVLERGRYENGRQCLLCASSRPLQVNKVRKAHVWNDFGRFARHLLELHVDEAFFFQCSARADGTYPCKRKGKDLKDAWLTHIGMVPRNYPMRKAVVGHGVPSEFRWVASDFATLGVSLLVGLSYD